MYKGTPIRHKQSSQQKLCRSEESEWYIQNAERKKQKNPKIVQPRALSPSRLPFRTEGAIKSSADKQQLKKFITTNMALQETLKQFLQAKQGTY